MYVLARLEDNFQESFLFLHPVGPRNQTQTIWFGGKYRQPLSKLTGSSKVIP